jgi:hypothetical protein
MNLNMRWITFRGAHAAILMVLDVIGAATQTVVMEILNVYFTKKLQIFRHGPHFEAIFVNIKLSFEGGNVNAYSGSPSNYDVVKSCMVGLAM